MCQSGLARAGAYPAPEIFRLVNVVDIVSESSRCPARIRRRLRRAPRESHRVHGRSVDHGPRTRHRQLEGVPVAAEHAKDERTSALVKVASLRTRQSKGWVRVIAG